MGIITDRLIEEGVIKLRGMRDSPLHENPYKGVKN